MARRKYKLRKYKEEDVPLSPLYSTPEEMEATRVDYITTIKSMEESNKTIGILNSLYKINNKLPNRRNDNLLKLVTDPEILSSCYHRLKSNTGSMTLGVDSSTADTISYQIFENLAKSIKDQTFEWSQIRRIYIPKPGKETKRPLGIPNFTDRIVQDNIRIILNTIYEPSFQELEVNYGFRPKRSTTDAIRKISYERQGMTTAIEGDIKGAFDNVDHKILKSILEKKISDKKFLKLIYNGLECGLLDKGKSVHTLTGVPQGGIASPILFNIYMHEFDAYIINYLQNYFEQKNITENRSSNNVSRKYDKLRIEINATKSRIRRLRTEIDGKTQYKDFKKYRENREQLRKLSTKKRATKSTSQSKTLLRFSYTRYADDWIILTNADTNTCFEIKEHIKTWLYNTLKLELSVEKTLITDLTKNHAKFLGYTFHIEKYRKVITFFSKLANRNIRRSRNVGFKIGLDNDRIRNRMTIEGIIKDLKPSYCKKYINLRPWEIVQKFRQKIMGLYNYYYFNITNKSDLNFYYYLLKYSCIRTIAHIKKTSTINIFKTYGQNITINYEKSIKNRYGQINIRQYSASIIPYKELMNWCQSLFLLERKKYLYKAINNIKKNKCFINSSKERNDFISKIEFNDFLINPRKLLEPLKCTNINLKTGFKLQNWCCICGAVHSASNPIHAHHAKHIKKGKVSGFSQILKALNRKTIPCCRRCHYKIHNGEFDGTSLNEFFDPVIAEL